MGRSNKNDGSFLIWVVLISAFLLVVAIFLSIMVIRGQNREGNNTPNSNLSVEFGSNSSLNERFGCERIDNYLLKDECYISLAVSQMNVSVCDLVRDPVQKERCSFAAKG